MENKNKNTEKIEIEIEFTELLATGFTVDERVWGYF